jgi:ankyrin repeat protein
MEKYMNIRQFALRTLVFTVTCVGSYPLSADNTNSTENNPVEIKNALIDAIKNHDAIVALALIAQDKALTSGQDKDGYTPLHLAVLAEMTPVVTVLAVQKTTLEALDNDKNTPLCLAAEKGFFSITELLLYYGANQHCTPSPLSIAAAQGQKVVVQRLMQNAFHQELGKALTAAAENKQWDIVQLLLIAGANPNENNGGALDWAASYGNLEIVKMLLVAGANPDELHGSPLQSAAYYGHTEIAKTLLAWHADANSRNYFWKTPLHYAAENGHAEILLELIHAGANPNVFEWGFLSIYRETPLHKAANAGHIACAQALLDGGADINALDIGEFKTSALSKARKYNRTAMVNFLLEHGAK